jgi:hypothetical protein
VSGSPFGLLVLTRRLLRAFTIAYVPFGPALDPGTGRAEMLSRIAAALRPHLPRNTLLVRFDLPWEKAGEAPDAPGAAARSAGGPPAKAVRPRKAANDIQPPSTVVVDISGSPEEILAGMKPKTRYNIRLASRKGVAVSAGSDADMGPWYEVYRETSRRDRIAIHAMGYYAGLFTAARGYPGSAPQVELFLARHEEDLLAGNIVLFWKDTAIYLTGASTGIKRNLMPTYALQWEAMQAARTRGCRAYDLYGIPPRPDPGHPMFGLYQFKTGFSEKTLERWGTWDVPFRPLACALYGAAEAARMAFYRGLRKRSRRRARAASGEPVPAEA